MIIPFVHLVIWTILIVLIEKGCFLWCKPKHNMPISDQAKDLDNDVKDEMDRVKQNVQNKD